MQSEFRVEQGSSVRVATVAIHQPNLFPWLGYFDKLARSDCFVFLDHVQLTSAGPWPKRVKILNNREARWLTVPTKDPGGFLPIQALEVNPVTQFEKKHLRTFMENYGKAPYFQEIFPLIQQFYESQELLLFKRNIKFIDAVCARLGIQTPRLLSSSLGCQKMATEMLIEIVQKVGAKAYLCGGGAQGYQQDHLFEQQEIKLIYQSFQHPVYPQSNIIEFVPGLSIIDALMHCGFAGVRQLLRLI